LSWLAAAVRRLIELAAGNGELSRLAAGGGELPRLANCCGWRLAAANY
jgi:hypothetical protein